MCAAVARALPHYEHDTIVVDVEDLKVQIQLGDQPGVWHRKACGGLETACGRPIDYRLALASRIESYREQLCTSCFTPHELAKSQRLNEEARKEDR